MLVNYFFFFNFFFFPRGGRLEIQTQVVQRQNEARGCPSRSRGRFSRGFPSGLGLPVAGRGETRSLCSGKFGCFRVLKIR